MFVTTTRRPLDTMTSLRRLNSVLDEAFNGWAFQSDENGSTVTSSWLPACDVFEDKDAVKIVAEVPGVRPEDVKISLENNLLTVRGEKKQQAEEKTERVHRYERSYGELRAVVLAAVECGPGADRGFVRSRPPDRHHSQGRAGPAPGDPGQSRVASGRDAPPYVPYGTGHLRWDADCHLPRRYVA